MSDVEGEDKASQASIGKLDDLNFPSWSIRMRTYLKSRDLWEVCSGEAASPAVELLKSADGAAFLTNTEDGELH
ncbi:hypothetical protein PSTG_07740 [Puccinia striiformis f. sp. tritici PST-78]|uniref:DUF4219 domain-containing protein n=1 Tax=Puccinia striiformis f. sp. tritici PST-78 TaxID=1165861 RepID=A0A0L0VIT7_9BASI|nr:hypothetical protein PSTG_07740 [Puccinia striiformis f. sp. tritici PST-78]